MATPDVLDFEKLLSPISDEHPAGSWWRGDDEKCMQAYYAVKDRREDARRKERMILNDVPEEDGSVQQLDKPDWSTVVKAAEDALSNHTKDLWIVAWLIEALARENGFAGLRDGYRLARLLCEKFWDQIHPRPETDEDGIAATVAQLAALDGSLPSAIRAIPITASGLSCHDYDLSEELEGVSDGSVREQYKRRGVVQVAEFKVAVTETGLEELQTIVDDGAACREEFNCITELLDERCGTNESGELLSPPSSTIGRALEECHERIETLVKPLRDQAAAASQQAASANGEQGPTFMGAPTNISNKQQAFLVMERIADFFEQSEPTSPVSYLIRESIRLGRMSLPELLRNMNEESGLKQIFSRMGATNKDD